MENKPNVIFEGLNSEQKNAVMCTQGPVLIVAGAGSGKTRVLTCRVANIIAKGCPPEMILSLTFTKKAATEMKERISSMVGQRNARLIRMGTFHSVFIRFLREFSGALGYPEQFTIYDQSDSQSAVKNCIKELGLDDKVYKPKDVLSRISMAKNNLVTPGAYRKSREAIENDTRGKKPRVVDIYELYWAKCRQSGVMDFDDILLNMNILLRDHPDALESIASRFRYILVDEYQDTNFSQYLILKKLCFHHKNICVVGDDSQSIYAFRGARIENILNFRKDYPENRVFRLEQNYRSTQTIVDAANSLISKNSARIPKVCFSKGDEGELIRLLNSYTDREEALQVVSSIVSRIYSDHAQYSDFAILYRTNAQSKALEDQLRRRNIPYMIYSGNSFFERLEVKDLMAYFKLAVNLKDDESYRRIVNRPARGIGDTSLSALAAIAQKEGISLFEASGLENLSDNGLKPAAIERLKKFRDMMELFSRKADKEDAYSLAASLALESGILQMYRADTSVEGQSRTRNVEELLDSVKAYVDERHNDDFEQMQAEGQIVDGMELSDSDLPVVILSDFLENVSLLSAVDLTDEEDSDNKVALMTVHSSKGLEFPYVYVVGMEENIFPSGGFSASPSDIEEERRLFYVALTRAEKALVLSFAQTRIRNGKSETNSPSRFIREIDRRYIQNPLREVGADSDEKPASDFLQRRKPVQGLPRAAAPGPQTQNPAPRKTPAAPVSPAAVAADFVPSPVLSLKAGQRVEHNRFGFGRILQISGGASDLKAKIEFDRYGEKLLILKYAKLRIVEQ